nr:hypothetical protein [Kordiimonas gwangyangensis]
MTIFDLYDGKGVPEGHTSVAVTVTLEPKGETFADKDIEAIAAKVVAAAEKAVGATLRG